MALFRFSSGLAVHPTRLRYRSNRFGSVTTNEENTLYLQQ